MWSDESEMELFGINTTIWRRKKAELSLFKIVKCDLLDCFIYFFYILSVIVEVHL